MNVIYCLVECRNKIDNLWETVAALICADLVESQLLIDSYTKNSFDICEYRVRECSKIEYTNTPCPIRMVSPTVREKDLQ